MKPITVLAAADEELVEAAKVENIGACASNGQLVQQTALPKGQRGTP
jgi:hypothetical protein